MTRITIGLALDVILLHQLCAELGLIGRILIFDVKDLVERAHIFRGIAMAIEAKSHLE